MYGRKQKKLKWAKNRCAIDETATVATAVTFSTMDDIKELRAAKYRLNQQQEQDQKKQNP